MQFVGDKMTPALRRMGEALATNVIRMLDGFVERPNTLVHGDYRADNLFFSGTGQGSPALAAVDWQVSSRGAGAFDLAYFLSGNVSTEVRRSIEMDLLKHYTDILRENGVRRRDDAAMKGRTLVVWSGCRRSVVEQLPSSASPEIAAAGGAWRC